MNRMISLIRNGRNIIIERVAAAVLKLKERILNLKISTKFVLFYIILLVLSVLLSSFLFQRINSNILENKIGAASIQTLNTISSSVDSLIENINNYSKMILSNEYIQKTLTQKNETFDLEASRTIDALLAGYMEAIPAISSIYLFDNNDNKYAVDRRTIKRLKIESLKHASWYNEAVEKRGKYIIKINAGGVFNGDSEENYVSFIRIINDVQFNKPIGFLIINIPDNSLKATYSKAVSGNNVSIAVFDKEDTVIDFENPALSAQEVLSNMKELDSEATVYKINREPYLVSSVESENIKWKFVSAMPFNQVISESRQFDFVTFFIILLNSIFLFIGAIFISRLITTPIKRLLEAMKKAEKGEFAEVHIRSGNDEIGKLRDGYNAMVSEIQNLIEKMMMEQKIKRKAELNVLQEQIKPHFLYNSLDAIAYMAMAGKGEDAYNVIIALSDYYRTCLSKGSEVITIADEVKSVRNYLTIQKVRFPKQFTDEYEIDESLENFKILKLILQPLVENALYHGIRPKGESGIIRVKVKREDEWIKLSVEDDGVGMDENELHKVIGSALETNSTSFGLRGTIERLKIFYGIEKVYDIWSVKGQGTTINIQIPMVQGAEDGYGHT